MYSNICRASIRPSITFSYIFHIFLVYKKDDPWGNDLHLHGNPFLRSFWFWCNVRNSGETCRLIEVFGADQTTCAGQSEWCSFHFRWGWQRLCCQENGLRLTWQLDSYCRLPCHFGRWPTMESSWRQMMKKSLHESKWSMKQRSPKVRRLGMAWYGLARQMHGFHGVNLQQFAIHGNMINMVNLVQYNII